MIFFNMGQPAAAEAKKKMTVHRAVWLAGRRKITLGEEISGEKQKWNPSNHDLRCLLRKSKVLCQDRQNTPHAKADYPRLARFGFKVPDRTSYVLARRVPEVQIAHEVLCLGRLQSDLAPVKVGHQDPVAGLS